MHHTNIIDLKKNIVVVLENTVKYNEPVNVSTNEGNAVIISEQQYNDLLATFELTSDPKMKEKIIDGLCTPLNDCIKEEEVQW